MGCLSCNAETAIATCDSYNWNLVQTSKKHRREKSIKIIKFSYFDLHSSTNGFSPSHLLGKGSHGSVYKAHLTLDQRNLIAAVKKTKQTDPTNPINCSNIPAENEIEILSRVRHSRLVNLLGYSVDPSKNKLIVVEYMPNGSLYDMLHYSSRPPGWARRVRFALQIARAVHFLHSSNPPIIHRDIKSSNILIDANFNARLSDFGLALRGHVEEVRVKSTPPAGTLGYLDPGYLAPGDLSAKSDVFSFGILLLEIISGRNAIDMNYSPPSLVDWAVPRIRSGDFLGIYDPRIRPPDDEAATRQLALVAATCVKSPATKRPEMAEVVERLKAVFKRVNNPIWNNVRRRVDCVRDSTRAVRYEPLEGSTETIKTVRVGSRRNRKISSVGSAEIGSDLIGGKSCDRVGRSRSIGSFREIDFGTLDLSDNDAELGVERRKGGLAVKMPTVGLRKSRSMGVLQSTSCNGIGIKLVKTPKANGRGMEESKLLVDAGKGTKGKNSEEYGLL